MKFLLFITLLITLTFAIKFKTDVQYSVVYDKLNDRFSVQEGLSKGWISWGVFQKTNKKTGWDILDVQSNPNIDDLDQAYAAGIIEGALTKEEIWDAWKTFWNGTLNFTLASAVQNWLLTNDKWVEKMANQTYTDPDEIAFWTQISFVIQQFHGVFDGYNQYADSDKKISYVQWLAYVGQDDLGDIQAALGLEPPNRYKDIKNYIYDTHCSSLVRLTPNGQKLFFSHDTWYTYEGMLRIYKHYYTPFHANSTNADRVSFSSNPGTLESGDDFYITNAYVRINIKWVHFLRFLCGWSPAAQEPQKVHPFDVVHFCRNLAIMETTNNIFNMSLYQYVMPQSVLYWMRNVAANRLASSADTWVKYFSMYNSGTYNNQWMVADYSLFTPGKPLLPNTLWIAEQIPGYVISGDVTSVLAQQGYWASYNIPYFPFVYNISGYPEMYKKNGNQFSYTMCPRAQIFARDVHTVVDQSTMKHIMRYNQWQTDPLSLGNACNSIASRCDLNAEDPFPVGALDCKVNFR